MTTYTCFRCNYTTAYKNSMVSHLKKKKKCSRQIDELNRFSDEEIATFSITKNCTIDEIINERVSNNCFDESNKEVESEDLKEKEKEKEKDRDRDREKDREAGKDDNLTELNKLNNQLLSSLSTTNSLFATNSFATTTTSITTQNTPNGVVNTKNYNIDINANCSMKDSLSMLDTQLTNCGMTDNVQRKQVLDAIEKSLSSLNDKFTQPSKNVFPSPILKNHFLSSTNNIGNPLSSIQTNQYTKNQYTKNQYTKNDYISKGY